MFLSTSILIDRQLVSDRDENKRLEFWDSRCECCRDARQDKRGSQLMRPNYYSMLNPEMAFTSDLAPDGRM